MPSPPSDPFQVPVTKRSTQTSRPSFFSSPSRETVRTGSTMHTEGRSVRSGKRKRNWRDEPSEPQTTHVGFFSSLPSDVSRLILEHTLDAHPESHKSISVVCKSWYQHISQLTCSLSPQFSGREELYSLGRRFSHITCLELCDRPTVWLPALKLFTNLVILSLSNSQLYAPGALGWSINRLPNLTHLDAHNAKYILNEDLKQLSALKDKLTHLDVSSARFVTGEGLLEIMHLTNLRHLDLTQIAVRQPEELFSNLKKLTFLGGGDLSFEHVQPMAALTSLKDLKSVKMTLRSLACLPILPELQRLEVALLNVHQMRWIRDFRALRCLKLIARQEPQAQYVHKLLQGLSFLEEVSLCIHAFDIKQTLALLPDSMPHLAHLDIHFCGTFDPDRMLDAMHWLSNCTLPCLSHLSLTQVAGKTVCLGLSLLTSLKSLRRLSLDFPLLVDSDIEEVLHLTRVEELDVFGRTHCLSSHQLRRLMDLPNFSKLRVKHSNVIL